VDKIRLVIADDHPAFREGLSRLLSDEGDLECIANTTDGEETVRVVKEIRPDVAIIDVSMPKLNGIEATKQIKAACPDIAILMVSAFDYDSYVLASLQAGASGYMTKSTSLGDLISAVRLVCRGESVLDVRATDKLVRHLTSGDGRNKKSFEHLYARELEIIQLAAKGLSNRAIAEKLIISERTVQTHLVNIFRKTGVNSRTQAVLYALKKGWLTPDDLA
jgi:DNA-binding NarL/FixJ family response regulator